MKLLDTRRLPGPNIIWTRPGTIADVQCTEKEAEALLPVWKTEARYVLDTLGWEHEKITHHHFSTGISLLFSAPIDALYAATEVNDYIWERTEQRLAGDAPLERQSELARLAALIAAETDPSLVTLKTAALHHKVSLLSDDEQISVGLGSGSLCWPVGEVPGPEEISWQQVHDIPVGIITGTNGKTTSARLSSYVIRCAGHRCGMSSTDWIGVDGDIVDYGDYSGPEGARTILRRTEVEMAVLETARGGLLRRGIGVPRANAALITNIAEDHLGDFGSQNLRELLDIKWVVTRVLDTNGRAVLNADDPLLVDKARGSAMTIDWFSLDPEHPRLRESLAAGGRVFSVRDGYLVCMTPTQCQNICAVNSIPITLGGAALHNVANALGVCALTHAMGIGLEQLAAGLTQMQVADNPGRCNLFQFSGHQVLVDFAHNPHGLAALFGIARALPARRRLLCFAQAGDRTDEQIRELARGVWAIGLERIIISELPKYYRGREHGEIYHLLRDELIKCGAKHTQIEHHESELDALDSAMSQAQAQDLIIMLALGDRDSILEKLKRESAH